MNKKRIEQLKENASKNGYTYTVELIDKIYLAYLIETNDTIKGLLVELLDYVVNY